MLSKMKTLHPLVMLIYMIFSFLAPTSGLSADFPYVVNDFNFYPIPDTPKPNKGAKYIDPVFGTEIVRITDAETEGGTYKYLSSGYPKWDIENADGTRLLLPNARIWNANFPYDKIMMLPSNIYDTIDPDIRWDAQDPEVLYTTYSSHFVKYNVNTGERTVLHDFKSDFPGLPIARVYTSEEGEGSDNRRYWAFMVRCYDANHSPTWWNAALLVYDKDYYGKNSGKVISVLYEDEPDFVSPNHICISPSGNYVQVGAPPSWIYDRDLNLIRVINTHGHVDWAIDNTGREVLVWVGNYYGPTGYIDYKYWAVMADVETGERFWLAPFGKSQLFHVSGNAHDKPGWALISSYKNIDESNPEWSQGSLLMYELSRDKPKPDWGDHSKVWRVAHTRNVYKNYDGPFGKINRKGTKIWFGSRWDQASPAAYDVYQINLPPTWYEDLKSEVNMPPVANISADPMSGNPPLTVNFTGTGKDYDGMVVSYAWDFGDGSTSTEQNPAHTYNNEGIFTVTLTVTDNEGLIGKAYVKISVGIVDTNPPAPPKGLVIIP